MPDYIIDLSNVPTDALVKELAGRPVHAILLTNDQIREVAHVHGTSLTNKECDEIVRGLEWWFDEQFFDRITDLL